MRLSWAVVLTVCGLNVGGSHPENWLLHFLKCNMLGIGQLSAFSWSPVNCILSWKVCKVFEPCLLSFDYFCIFVDYGPRNVPCGVHYRCISAFWVSFEGHSLHKNASAERIWVRIKDSLQVVQVSCCFPTVSSAGNCEVWQSCQEQYHYSSKVHSRIKGILAVPG